MMAPRLNRRLPIGPTRICRTCTTEKDISEFLIRKDTGRPVGECRTCRSSRLRRWREDHPDASARHQATYAAQHPGLKASRRRASALKKYGLTVAQYEAVLERQGGGCAICGNHACCPDPCSSCGECVRGLLCSECNVALGYYESKQKRALCEAYLARHLTDDLTAVG